MEVAVNPSDDSQAFALPTPALAFPTPALAPVPTPTPTSMAPPTSTLQAKTDPFPILTAPREQKEGTPSRIASAPLPRSASAGAATHSSTPSSTAKLSRTQSSPGTPSRAAFVLNLTLEGIFLFSLRPESANNESIKYLGDAPATPAAGSPRTKSAPLPVAESPSAVSALGEASVLITTLLTPDNITECIIRRLDASRGRLPGDGGNSGAIPYLFSCFKRLADKEGTCAAEHKDGLDKAKTTIVNYAASALTVPELFGANSLNSKNDLFSLLCEDASPVFQAFMASVAAELAEQETLGEIVESLLEVCRNKLDTAVMPSGPGAMFRHGPVRSVLDPHTLHVARALLMLCRSHKKAAVEVATSPCFALDGALIGASRGAQPSNVFMFGGMPPPRQGAALESLTLLGKLLRLNVDARDEQLTDLLEVRRTTQQQLEQNMTYVRSRHFAVLGSVAEAVHSLLKFKGPGKDATLLWLTQSIEENAENEKSQPSPIKASSRDFMVNLNCIWLNLCLPFINKPELLQKIDFAYLQAPESARAIPRDSTQRLMSPGTGRRGSTEPSGGASLGSASPSSSSSSSSAAMVTEPVEFSFVTKAFFLTWRCLHLGIAPQCREYRNLRRAVSYHRDELEAGEPRAVFEYKAMLCLDTVLGDMSLLTWAVSFCSAASSVLMRAFGEDGTDASSALGGSMPSILPPSAMTPAQQAVLDVLPDYFVDDILVVLLFAAKIRPAVLNGSPMESVLSLVIFFLRRPWAMHVPNMRASLGEVLYKIFLPRAERGSDHDHYHHYHGQQIPDGPQSSLVAYSRDAQCHLAPSMLLLYGDVEHTGHYDKVDHRRRIAAVLKFLWSITAHRAAFRGIVTGSRRRKSSLGDGSSMDVSSSSSSGGDSSSGSSSGGGSDGDSYEGTDSGPADNAFITFANGVMNEVNSMFANLLESLAVVKDVQGRRSAPEWAQQTDEHREQHRERLQEAEGKIKGSASLIFEVLSMVNYLTTDEVLRRQFLLDEMLPRFVGMLGNAMSNLAGPKSRDFDGVQGYDVDPLKMLREVCQIVTHVAPHDEFCRAVLKDGYYDQGKTLDNVLKLVATQGVVDKADRKILEDFKASLAAIGPEEELDVPEQFKCGLLYELMRDPVRLPSNNICCRTSMRIHLLNQETDPFTMMPLTESMLVPVPELKAQIDDWLEEQRAIKMSLADSR